MVLVGAFVVLVVVVVVVVVDVVVVVVGGGGGSGSIGVGGGIGVCFGVGVDFFATDFAAAGSGGRDHDIGSVVMVVFDAVISDHVLRRYFLAMGSIQSTRDALYGACRVRTFVLSIT